MTLPASPPLSLLQIQGEFGGPGDLAAYYAGSGFVPPGTSGTFGPVPSSGPLDILIFCGTSNTSFLQQVTLGVGSSGGGSPLYGYSSGFGFGTISTTAFYAGGNITDMWWNSSDGTWWFILDTGQPQGIFTNININGNIYASAAAAYGGTTWRWPPGGNPFGTSGSIVVTFT